MKPICTVVPLRPLLEQRSDGTAKMTGRVHVTQAGMSSHRHGTQAADMHYLVVLTVLLSDSIQLFTIHAASFSFSNSLT